MNSRLPSWRVLSALLSLTACAEPQGSDGYAGARYQDRPSLPSLATQRGALQVCADGPTTFGIDVSRWQSTIDWAQVASDGVRYAIIRVSNGTSALDQEFVANWTNARDAGILRGSYQYFRPGQDPIAQAEHFVSALREQGDVGELPPVIDVEETDDEPPAVVRAGVRAWIDYVQAELNVRPMIYSGRYFWGPNVCGGDLSVCESFAEYPLWHPQYGTNPVDPPQNADSRSCPNISDTWARWDFWQYGSQGRIEGIGEGRTNVDMNVFNGDYEALLAFAAANGGGMWEPPGVWEGRPRGQSFPLASEDPISLCVGERLAGEIYVDNEGNRPWGPEVVLAPTPRDQASSLASPSWRSSTRVGPATSVVAPGERGTFAFVIEPQQEGLMSQTFNLVAEGVDEGADLWFSDSGGPHDEYLQLRVEARSCESLYEGELQRYSCEGVEGWAWDSLVPGRYPRVQLRVAQAGQIFTAVGVADLSAEPDCEQAECSHRFSIPWPEGVDPSQVSAQDLSVEVQGEGGRAYPLSNGSLTGSCGAEGGAEGGAEAGAAGAEAGQMSGGSEPREAGEQGGGQAGAELSAGSSEGGATLAGAPAGGAPSDGGALGGEELAGTSGAELRSRSSGDEGCEQGSRRASPLSALASLALLLGLLSPRSPLGAHGCGAQRPPRP